MSLGILYIVGTPIGNLKDITLRALDVLKEVDLILAEDTRVTQKLLSHYKISKPLRRYDEYAKENFYKIIKEELLKGKNMALVTDAGTPGISDPGAKLVSYVISRLSSVKIVPIPGPSAAVAALSVSGLNANQFTFLGYPPHKKGRQTFFKNLLKIETRPIILYESPHRLTKTLAALKETLGEDYKIIVARELTKIYEEVFKGVVSDAEKYFKDKRKRGEFVIAIP